MRGLLKDDTKLSYDFFRRVYGHGSDRVVNPVAIKLVDKMGGGKKMRTTQEIIAGAITLSIEQAKIERWYSEEELQSAMRKQAEEIIDVLKLHSSCDCEETIGFGNIPLKKEINRECINCGIIKFLTKKYLGENK